MKSFFFFDTESGELQGKWTLPRDQTEFENCTLHNYNVVPTRKRDILVHGSYQSGIGVLDFTTVATRASWGTPIRSRSRPARSRSAATGRRTSTTA